MMDHTYDLTYQYKPDEWHTHYQVDHDTAAMMLRMLSDLGRDCRVRQNATGYVVEVPPARGVRLPVLLHLFSIGISDRSGKDADQ